MGRRGKYRRLSRGYRENFNLPGKYNPIMIPHDSDQLWRNGKVIMRKAKPGRRKRYM